MPRFKVCFILSDMSNARVLSPLSSCFQLSSAMDYVAALRTGLEETLDPDFSIDSRNKKGKKYVHVRVRAFSR